MKSVKKHIVLVLVVILSAAFIVAGSVLCSFESKMEQPEAVAYAKVIELGEVKEHSIELGGDGFEPSGSEAVSTYKEISFTAEIKRGDIKGKVVKVTQSIESFTAVKIKEVEEGDAILITFSEQTDSGSPGWVFVDYNRVNVMIALCAAFLLLIVIIGRKKGITTIISLIFTCAAIFMVYIPSILNGYNVYASTIIICIFIVVMSLIVIDGANKKTFCAILGNIGGVAVAGALIIVMSNILKLTGLIDEDYIFLSYLNADNPLDLKAVIWGAIIVGALGAIMDVSMSIASSMNELAEHMEERSFSKMLKSGMNIGRDAIGTMTNTLVLAYIGGSLALVLLLISTSKSIDYLLNMEMIVVEVMQAVIGSIGILVAVPITALLAAYAFAGKGR